MFGRESIEKVTESDGGESYDIVVHFDSKLNWNKILIQFNF